MVNIINTAQQFYEKRDMWNIGLNRSCVNFEQYFHDLFLHQKNDAMAAPLETVQII